MGPPVSLDMIDPLQPTPPRLLLCCDVCNHHSKRILAWSVRSANFASQVHDSSLRHYLCYNCALNDLKYLLEEGAAPELPPARTQELDLLYQSDAGMWLVDFEKARTYLKRFIIPYSKHNSIYGGNRRPALSEV